MDDPHAAHLAACTPAARERLIAVREVLEAAVPGAERTMAYQMPAIRQGRIIAYFAAFKQHIGIYPPVREPAELVAELAPYAGPKGNLSFPHKAELPLDLIGRVGKALAAQYARQA